MNSNFPELDMLTGHRYPKEFCPSVNEPKQLLESFGNINIYIANEDNLNHKAILEIDGKITHETSLQQKNKLDEIISKVYNCNNALIIGMGLGLTTISLYYKTNTLIVVEENPDLIELMEPKIRAYLRDWGHSIRFTSNEFSQIIEQCHWDFVMLDLYREVHSFETLLELEDIKDFVSKHTSSMGFPLYEQLDNQFSHYEQLTKQEKIKLLAEAVFQGKPLIFPQKKTRIEK